VKKEGRREGRRDGKRIFFKSWEGQFNFIKIILKIPKNHLFDDKSTRYYTIVRINFVCHTEMKASKAWLRAEAQKHLRMNKSPRF
jgi:hypothetical protein